MNFSSFASWRSSSETRTTSSRSWARVMVTSSVPNGGRGPVCRHTVDWDHGAVQHQVLQTVSGSLAQRLADLGRVCSWQPQRPRWHTATRWRAETGDPATGPAQVSPLRRYTWVIKACGRRQAPDFAADGLTVPSDDPGSMAHSSARQRQRSAIQQRARPVVGGRPVVRDQPSYQGFFISQGLHGNRDHAVISTRRSAAEEGSLDFHLDSAGSRSFREPSIRCLARLC